jgi:hypothetical protein
MIMLTYCMTPRVLPKHVFKLSTYRRSSGLFELEGRMFQGRMQPSVLQMGPLVCGGLKKSINLIIRGKGWFAGRFCLSKVKLQSTKVSVFVCSE